MKQHLSHVKSINKNKLHAKILIKINLNFFFLHLLELYFMAIF